jgi:hypothetical protein
MVKQQLEKIIKVKINPEQRKLFPELATDLEFNGLQQPVLIDKLGYTHDGEKRRLLLGLEQIKALSMLKEVPIESECSNISPNSLTNEQKQAIVIDLHKQFTDDVFANANVEMSISQKQKVVDSRNNFTFVKMCAKRYGVNKATVYRWLNIETLTQYEKDKKARGELAAKNKKAELAVKFKEEQAKHEKDMEIAGSHDTSLDVLLLWLDSPETPKIEEYQRNRLLALKDALNKLLGVDA